METAVKKLYEGMFLIDSAEAARDWDGILELINRILTRADCEIVSVRKWDERPLAYAVKKCTRGTYILTYFRSDGTKINEIERDVQLSERILRMLVLRADHLTEEAIAKDTPATRVEKQRQAPEESAEPQSAEEAGEYEETQADESEPVTESVGDESQEASEEKEE